MRIGLFSETYHPYISGVVTSILTLKKALEKMGHEVYVVTINQEKNKYEYKDRVLKIPGIKAGIYDDVKVATFYSLRSTNQIKKWNLDIIHTHTEFSMGIYGRILSKQFNIPLVHTYHTMLEDYVYLVTKGLFDKPVKKILKHFVVFNCNKMVSELIVPTKKTYDLFKNKYNMSRNIHIIPTGIDIKRFDNKNFDSKEILNLRKRHNISSNDFVLLSISRVSKEKNIDFLIENQLKMKENVKLVIIGDGPYKKDLEKKVNKLNLNNNVIFVGKIEWKDIPLYYQLGDVFVTASKTETQGLTVNEALASSIPVVCINDSSYKSSVFDNVNGMFFKTKKEYVDKIKLIIEDKNMYKKMCVSAKKSSIDFSEEIFGKKVLSVYESALKNKKARKFDVLFKKRSLYDSSKS